MKMKALKEKYLRPGRKITDQFVLATGLSVLIMVAAEIILPIGGLLLGSFGLVDADERTQADDELRDVGGDGIHRNPLRRSARRALRISTIGSLG